MAVLLQDAGSVTPRSEGFSLVEAVVAAGLLAVSLAALAQLSATAVRNAISTKHHSTATVLAAQKIEELLGGASPLSVGGSLTADADGYRDQVDDYNRRWSVEAIEESTAVLVKVLVIHQGEQSQLLATIARPQP